MVDEEWLLWMPRLVSSLFKIHIFLLLISALALLNYGLRYAKSAARTVLILRRQEAYLALLRSKVVHVLPWVDELARLLNDFVMIEGLPELLQCIRIGLAGHALVEDDWHQRLVAHHGGVGALVVLLVDGHGLDGRLLVRREDLAVFLVVVNDVRGKQGQVARLRLGLHVRHAARLRGLVYLEVIRLYRVLLLHFLLLQVVWSVVVERELVLSNHPEFE